MTKFLLIRLNVLFVATTQNLNPKAESDFRPIGLLLIW